ncbi:MAG: 30S ribosomal protein S12 methylthiotransferase RimO [Chlamydiota bacterium]
MLRIRRNKFHFTSLGCARNLVDSEEMIAKLLKNGYEITGEEEKADYLIVNTCGFLEASRQEALDVLGEIFATKKSSAKVVVAGCMVQNYRHVIEAEYPGVHYLLGSGDVEHIIDAVRGNRGQMVSDARSYLASGEVPEFRITPQNYAYIKIAEGCKKRCSFCIIPDIKGPLRSKTEARVLKEFRSLLQDGVEEVILIAQDLGDYGKDRKEKQGLHHLVRAMLEEKGDYWLRFLYLYPDEIDEELIEIMASDRRICRYLDMPIQHISDRILRKMHRKTSKKDILTTIETLKKHLPGVVIRTSLMVGFPGETEEEFAELLAFVEEGHFHHAGVFMYSREKGSYSHKLSGHLPEEIKNERYHRLMQAQEKSAQKNNQRLIGKRLSVIVEGYHEESSYLLRGRYYGQAPDVDGIVILNDFEIVDALYQRYEVEITDVNGYDLVGKVLAKASSNSPLTVVG